jgi:hypothetical protein
MKRMHLPDDTGAEAPISWVREFLLFLTPNSTKSLPSVEMLISVASKHWSHLLLILLIGVILCLPCIFYGVPNGYNTRTHLNYQHHFSHQFWNGDLYPRWLAQANKGYGSPIFVVQYPLPYFATALLRPFTSYPSAVRDARELGLFAWLALTAAGVSAWLWLKQLASPRAALFGTLFYMSLPYVLGQALYVRVAIGELVSFIWMPLAFYFCDWIYQNNPSRGGPAAPTANPKRHFAVLALSAVFALLILSNVLDAVLFAPALTAYGVLAGQRRSYSLFRAGIIVCLAELFGVALAGAYLGPLFAYRRMFDLRQLGVHLPGYRLGFYFLGIGANSLTDWIGMIALWGTVLCTVVGAWYCWRTKATARIRALMILLFLLGGLILIPDLGLWIVRLGGFSLSSSPFSDFSARITLCILLTFVFGCMAYCSRAADSSDHRSLLLLWIVGVAFFFMLPFSASIWKAIPASSVIQFPYRVAGIQSVAVAGLGAMAFERSSEKRIVSRWWRHLSVIEVAALVVSLGGIGIWRIDRAFRHPATATFDVTQDVDSMYRTYVSPEQVLAFADSLGTTPKSYAFQARLGEGTFRFHLVSGNCTVKVTPGGARHINVVSECAGEGLLRIGQTYFPLWRIVSEAGVASLNPTPSPGGLNELRLSPGRQELRLVFDGGTPERLGTTISAVSLAGLIGAAIFEALNIRRLAVRSNT